MAQLLDIYLPLQIWSPKHDTRGLSITIYPFWPGAIRACSRSEDGSELPSLGLCLGNHCHLIQASPRGMLLLQIYYRRGGRQTGLWQGSVAWTWAGRAGKGSVSGSHRGFAKWSWVMSAVLGWGGIMVDWEYRSSAVHTILISPYQKKAKQSLLFSVRNLHIVHVCFLEIKRAGILFEIGVSFIFKEQQMTRITSLNTTLKSRMLLRNNIKELLKGIFTGIN